MAITSMKTGSSFTNLQKYNSFDVGYPPAPIIGTATDGGTGTTVSVAFTGVSGATSYTALSTPGSLTATGSASPITVSGLTSGTAYTFQVRATNSIGTGVYSAASNSVTPVVPSSYESIATATPSATNTVTFSSIPSTYKHLQIRVAVNNTGGGTLRLQFNGNTTTNYSWHAIQGNGSSADRTLATSTTSIDVVSINEVSNQFGVGVIEVMDYTSTTKNKIVRRISGQNSNGFNQGLISVGSGMLINTGAVTSITLSSSNNFNSGTRFALYGIKG